MSITFNLEGTFDLSNELCAKLIRTLSTGAKRVAMPHKAGEFRIESTLLVVGGEYRTIARAMATDYGATYAGADRIARLSFHLLDKEQTAEAYDFIVSCTNVVLGATTGELMLLFEADQPFLHRTGDDLQLFLETDGENAFWKNHERFKRITQKFRFVRWRE